MRGYRRDLSAMTWIGAIGGLLAVLPLAEAADLSTPVFKAAPVARGSDLGTPPAVDAFNVKFEGFGGSVNGKSLVGGAGALTVPVGGQFGAQIDGLAGALDGDALGGVAGHLFWRDPSRALLGIYGSYTTWDRFGGVNAGQVAFEGEYYLGRFTVQGIAGVEFGNSRATSSSISSQTAIPFGTLNTLTTSTQRFDITTRYFDQINFKYYFNDNLSTYVGHRYLGGRNMAALGGEFAFPLNRGLLASAFVEGRVGESDARSIWGGFHIYFGPDDKPLIKRHRQEDPNLWLIDTASSILNNQKSTTSSQTQTSCNTGTPNPDGTCDSGT